MRRRGRAVMQWWHSLSFIESNTDQISKTYEAKAWNYPRWLVNKFTLFIFSRVVTPHTGQDPGRGPGRPGTVIREIFWFIILRPEFPHSGLPCPPLVLGTEAWTIRTQFTQSCWHKRLVFVIMRVAWKVIIDLWLRKIGVRFVANLCENHKQMNIYQQMTFGQT